MSFVKIFPRKEKMKKIKIVTYYSFIIISSYLLFYGCSKTNKQDETKKERPKEQLDTGKFYEFGNLQYWQNYPGKLPHGDADMVEVKDQAKIEKIKKAIAGETEEDVYTCEMHPQVHQNYHGKCPICKMELVKQEKNTSSLHHKTHEEMDALWQGKPNIIHKELAVPKAKCDKCDKIISDALSKDNGVMDKVVDTDEHRVHLYLDKTKTNIENVENLILDAGFDIGSKKGNPDAYKNLPDCCK